VLALTLYEVLDAEAPERREAKEATRHLLDGGRERYLARDFQGALDLFTQAQRIDPADAVPGLLGDRCRRYAADPPPPAWQGYEALDFK
jgi:hypothetical protein